MAQAPPDCLDDRGHRVGAERVPHAAHQHEPAGITRRVEQQLRVVCGDEAVVATVDERDGNVDPAHQLDRRRRVRPLLRDPNPREPLRHGAARTRSVPSPWPARPATCAAAATPRDTTRRRLPRDRRHRRRSGGRRSRPSTHRRGRRRRRARAPRPPRRPRRAARRRRASTPRVTRRARAVVRDHLESLIVQRVAERDDIGTRRRRREPVHEHDGSSRVGHEPPPRLQLDSVGSSERRVRHGPQFPTRPWRRGRAAPSAP